MTRWHIGLIALAAFSIVCYLTITVFVIPPIGAVPEGRTLVIIRVHNLHFVDSPDGFCQRHQDGVSLLCRGLILAKVVNEAPILLRLPYSDSLYLISTGGTRYNR